MKLKAMYAIAIMLMGFLTVLIGLTSWQYSEILQLRKDYTNYQISTDYSRVRAGVTSGDQFPLIGGEWFICTRVETE